jgi:hypothetical protein
MHNPNVVRHWLESHCPVFIEIAAVLGDPCDVWRHHVDEPQDAHAASLLRASCCSHRYVMAKIRIGSISNLQQWQIRNAMERRRRAAACRGWTTITRHATFGPYMPITFSPNLLQACTRRRCRDPSGRLDGSSHIKCRLLLLRRSMTSD